MNSKMSQADENVHELLATAKSTIAQLEHVVATQAAHIAELSVEEGDGGRPSRAQLLAECRVLARRWAETDVQLDECRKNVNEHVGDVIELRRQIVRLEREMHVLRPSKSTLLPDNHNPNKEENEEVKAVQRFLTDLATFRENESGLPKKLRAALEARIKLVVSNARRFSGYVTDRTPSSSAIAIDQVANGTTLTPAEMLSADEDYPPRMYRCRVNILPPSDR